MSTFPGILPVKAPVAEEFKKLHEATQRVGVAPPRGIFSEFGGATPKYARNQGPRESDYRESMSRLFVQLPSKEAYDKFWRTMPPESQALAQVLAGTGNHGEGGSGYIDFLLQNVAHSFQEKADVIETLADNYVVYFFGQSAPMFQYGGMLINTIQDDQAVNMYRLYRDILRGTQLARRKQVVRLRYDNYIVSGTMMNLNIQLTAENESVCPFSFQLLVKSVTLIPNDEYGLVVLAESFDPVRTSPTVGVVSSTEPVNIRTDAVQSSKTEGSAVSQMSSNVSNSSSGRGSSGSF